jgi:hypothetical protein
MWANGERASDGGRAHSGGLAMGPAERVRAVDLPGLQKGAGMKWDPKPAPGELNRRDPNRCATCDSWLVAIAPDAPLVWPYRGLELACPKCDSLVCIDEVKDWWRRAGKESV